MKTILVLLAALWAAAAPARPPNVVVIFIDDLGYGDIGPFGATKQRTPHLDRMAKEGIKLTSFYATPVCSVSRAQMMTGCYGARVSVPGVYFPGQSVGLNPSEVTVAERLKEKGYATQMVGKWHLGDQPEFLPTRQGFDHYFGIPYSNDMLKKSAETKTPVVPLLRDEKVVELMDGEGQRRMVELYAKEAVDFITRSKDRPFYLYFAHNAVHTPIWPGAAFAGKSQNGRFGDWVEEMDWSVGQVLDALRSQGLDKDTIVVFTSDNGPWLTKGADGGSAGPLRGGKGSTWEGGVRVPTLAWWPGRIPAGAVNDAVAATIDLLPTFVALAGGAVPATPVIDGRDITPILLGQSKESAREAHYYFSGYELQAVRQGRWKLALVPQPEGMGKQAAKTANGLRLYDLDADIGEQADVAARHPEVVAKLKALAEKTAAEIGGKTPAARRPAGEVKGARTLYPTVDYVPNDAKKDDARQPAAKKGAPKAAAKSVALAQAKPGDAIPSAAAPQVGQKAFTLAVTVDTTQRDAVLLAQGGLIGHALYLKGGRVAFAVRHGADEVVEIVSPAEVKGSFAVTAGLAADGAMKLVVAGQDAVTGKAKGTLPRQPAEDFCVGHDNGKPVGLYGEPKPLQGAVAGLAVTTP
ncbi:MAG: sulfatase [Verrucomicrobia bacterium]|nr:sulfatase [Verrucomicrobiota bacterium]